MTRALQPATAPPIGPIKGKRCQQCHNNWFIKEEQEIICGLCGRELR